MARPGRWLLGLGAASLLAATPALRTGVARVPEALAGIEHFRVTLVEVEGRRYLTTDEVESLLALPAGASVWDDPARWEARLRTHPMVRRVRIERRLPSTLVVRLEERAPVALLADPVLEPVDARGRPLPLDPVVHGLDLPLIHLPPAPPSPPSRLARVLAGEAARLARTEPSFARKLSELSWDGRGEVVARWGDPGVLIRFRPPLPAGRAREAMAVLADAAARRPERSVELVDLRWADQVVLRYRSRGAS